MRITAASPVQVTLDRKASVAAVLVRVDAWSWIANDWQEADSVILQVPTRPQEGGQLTLANGSYTLRVTVNVGQKGYVGQYDFDLLIGGQRVPSQPGNYTGTDQDGQTLGMDIDLTVA